MLTTLLVVSFLFSCIVSSHSLSSIESWCSKTPYPQPCEYYLSNQGYNQTIKNKSDFFKVSLKIAIERAKMGQQNTNSLGPKCRNPKEKAAWDDCIELYHYTIKKLNETIGTKCTQIQSQTWLSTALTNLETCKNGFYDLGVTNYVLPLLSNNNITKLLSNTLSLNKVPYQQPNYKDGFPTWVKPGDRKLLQTSSAASKANVVVAKDGSGKFTTVNAAVSAAPSSSSGRYVIYVKSGVYNEQVDIKAKNIMLVGDGIGKTIITGSKSVGGGTTTFRSATVCKLIPSLYLTLAFLSKVLIPILLPLLIHKIFLRFFCTLFYKNINYINYVFYQHVFYNINKLIVSLTMYLFYP